MNDDWEFSHYEDAWDEGGWMYLKAWYINAKTRERKYLIVCD